MALIIGLVNASLPSYFPQKHGVFEAAGKMLDRVVSEGGHSIVEASSIPMDAIQTRATLAELQAAGADFILLLHGGFSMGDVVRELALSDLPLGVWATPEPVLTGDVQLNNFVSLNMSMSIARGVRDMTQNPVQWYLGAPEDSSLVARLRQTMRALAARKSLQGARIGMVGGLAPTFYNMEVSTDSLVRSLGVWVEHIDMHTLTDLMATQSDDDVAQELVSMSSVAQVDGVSDAQMALTARAALGMRALAQQGGYDALAVSDWPALQEYPGLHPGAAFSWLEEIDGLPVASEGDVLGAVTQLVVKSLTGRPGCLLDMTSPDFSRDQILMWHGGGGPLYMAKNHVSWINHPMIGRGTVEGPVHGAIADYQFAHGPVTVTRIARSGTAQFVVEGEVAEGPADGFTGCRGWVGSFTSRRESCSAADIVTTVMEQGLEHHFILLPGHEEQVLAEFAGWCGLQSMEVINAHDGLPGPVL